MIISDELLEKMKDLNFTDEQINFVNEEVVKNIYYKNGYKIMCGKPYICYQQHYNDKSFYKISVAKKNSNGRLVSTLKNVTFLNCEPPKTESAKIIIKSFFEDFYENPKDKFNSIFPLKILDYELIDKEKDEKLEEERALQNYQDNLSGEFDDISF